MPVSIDSKKIKELLEKGVEEVIVRKHLEQRLLKGERLRIKFGIDPTSSELHLGHSIPLQKLRQFQELGHQVIFLIGDFTGLIGDPSGRAATRKPLTESQITENMKTYTEQAGKILNMKKVEIRYNSEWYKEKGVDFLTGLTSRFTYARLVERDEFKRRIEKNIDISILELIYPLLQGYDSVALKADVEIGGTDQKFNLLFARRVQKKFNVPQQDIITMSLLIGTDGSSKMSKSFNNYIKLTEEPKKMFAQIMSIPDTLMWHYFNLLTKLSPKEVKKIQDDINRFAVYRRDAKAKLAKEITAVYHGKKAAELAEIEFERVFKEKKLPSKIPTFRAKKKSYPILDLLFDSGLTSSKSEAKRLILEKAVKISGKIIANWQAKIKIKKGMVLQVGKRKFKKLL